MAGEPALGALARAVRRVPLARGAWVDLRPGWLEGSAAVFAALVETVPWRAERRHMYDRVVDVPRLLCFYGEGEPLPDPLLTAALGRAERALCGGAGRAVPDRGAVPVPGRAGQRGLARRHDRAGRAGGHHGRDLVAGRAAGAGAAAARRRAGRCGSRSGTATCWSWAELPAHLGARRAEDGTPAGPRISVQSGRGACAEPPAVACPGAASGRRRISSRCGRTLPSRWRGERRGPSAGVLNGQFLRRIRVMRLGYQRNHKVPQMTRRAGSLAIVFSVLALILPLIVSGHRGRRSNRGSGTNEKSPGPTLMAAAQSRIYGKGEMPGPAASGSRW